VTNAFGADQQIRQFADAMAGTAQHHHFEARVVVQMCVRRGNHNIVISMLDIHQFDGKHPEVVIVNERHRADNGRLRIFNGYADQLVSNQVPERFRPIGIALLLYEAVKPV
jgi:hypothetical protein